MDVIKVEKRNEQAKANQLRRAGISGLLWVFAPLIPAMQGEGTQYGPKNGIKQKSNDLQPLSPS